MSEEIVRRLRNRSRESMNILKESLKYHRLSEAGEDEEDEEDIVTAEDEIADDSTAPEQGNPDDYSEEEEVPDSEESDNSPPRKSSGGSLRGAPSEEDTEEEYVDPEGDTEDEVEDDPEESTDEYVNPLDNNYAVKHTIGDKVLLAYSNGTKSKLKGEIDGYDTEGFYRIRWSNGLTTNGITDLALADLISRKDDSKCVCGGTDFVNEGINIVCDRCGRKIRESNSSDLDPLTLADKSRPKGKKLVRSEAHPVSTVMKPDISEAIKKALKGNQVITEDYDEEDIFDKLKTLENEFWTNLSEIAKDIEDLGYTVDEINNEYVVVSTEDEDDDYELYIPIGGTSRTMTLDFQRARSV